MKKPTKVSKRLAKPAIAKAPDQAAPFNQRGFNEEVNYAIDNLSRHHPAVKKVQEKVKGKIASHFQKLGFGASD